MNVTLITALFVSVRGLTESQDQTYLLYGGTILIDLGVSDLNNNMCLIKITRVVGIKTDICVSLPLLFCTI